MCDGTWLIGPHWFWPLLYQLSYWPSRKHSGGGYGGYLDYIGALVLTLERSTRDQARAARKPSVPQSSKHAQQPWMCARWIPVTGFAMTCRLDTGGGPAEWQGFLAEPYPFQG